jgi:catechol 2,3-dioxygenase-like lactoylglutathione lyase family enzyme
MHQTLGLITLVVRDYDEALDFYLNTLGFELLEDKPVPEQNKRWVVMAPKGTSAAGGGTGILLGRAVGDEQTSRIGNQSGGRVFLFLYTDDFWRDFKAYTAKGVRFVRPPVEQPYGTVAVFADLYGNLWDLVQMRPAADPAGA